MVLETGWMVFKTKRWMICQDLGPGGRQLGDETREARRKATAEMRRRILRAKQQPTHAATRCLKVVGKRRQVEGASGRGSRESSEYVFEMRLGCQPHQKGTFVYRGKRQKVKGGRAVRTHVRAVRDKTSDHKKPMNVCTIKVQGCWLFRGANICKEIIKRRETLICSACQL
jgi:hypothetical protein